MKNNNNEVNSRKGKRKTIKKNRKRKIWMSILIPIGILFIIVTAYALNLFGRAQRAVNDAYEDDGRERSELREFDVDPADNHVSVLFIGIDESDHRDNSGNALSDALILATLNKDENSVKLLSIPRDSYVYIPERGTHDKINHAHAFGGSKATIDAVEGFLNVPVDYFVRLNFHAFVDVVDALGGITVDVPFEFRESDSNDRRNSIHLYPGVQEIDGEEALAFARTRKMDNDIERGKRQQQVMEAILDKAVSIGSIMRFDNVIDAVGDNMSTSLSFNQMMSFISYGTSGELDVETLNLEGSDLWLPNSSGQRIYYFELDEEHLAETQRTLREHLELD